MIAQPMPASEATAAEARAQAGARPPRSLLARHPRCAAFALYLLLGLALGFVEFLTDPTHLCACGANTDPSAFMWSLLWWPHAIAHGLNPFLSHVVWAPGGVDLAKHTTIPLPALALWPITALAGPLVAYNVLTVASPTLAGFTAHLLCRRLAGRELPALAGGLIFGFGSYQFAQLTAHINLSLVFLVPLAPLLALRRRDGELSRAAYVSLLAALLVAQMGISSEVLATGALLGGLLLIAAWLMSRGAAREAAARLIGESAAAFLLALALTAPFVYYALHYGGGAQDWNFADRYALDLLNLFFPTQITWLGGHAFQTLANNFEEANSAEGDGYLSIALIAAFWWWLAHTQRRLLARLLLLAVTLSLLVALGAHLHVAGTQTIALPYKLVEKLPVLRLVTPARMSLYLTLAAAIAASAWLAEPRSLRPPPALRWALVGAAVLLTLPAIGKGIWQGRPANPRFFTAGIYRHYLKRNEMLLVFPFGDDWQSMLWQAETDFYFRMPEGYLGHTAPQAFEREAIFPKLYGSARIPPTLLRSFLRKYAVRDVLIDLSAGDGVRPIGSELIEMGARPIKVGGIYIFRLPSWLG